MYQHFICLLSFLCPPLQSTGTVSSLRVSQYHTNQITCIPWYCFWEFFFCKLYEWGLHTWSSTGMQLFHFRTPESAFSVFFSNQGNEQELFEISLHHSHISFHDLLHCMTLGNLLKVLHRMRLVGMCLDLCLHITSCLAPIFLLYSLCLCMGFHISFVCHPHKLASCQ